MTIEDAQSLIQKNSSDINTYNRLELVLTGPNDDRCLPVKFRALFALKNLNTEAAVAVLCRAIEAPINFDNALLMHELAYVLGQMKFKSAVPVLERILRNRNLVDIIRHEAAEALGAIGDYEYVSNILHEFSRDSSGAVRETCELALEKLKLEQAERLIDPANGSVMYNSVDPAPAFESDRFTITELQVMLLEEAKPLFERYRAMFTLRNIGTSDAVKALASGLLSGKSALFRHEIAFVFGQMLHQDSVEVLKSVLENDEEVDMVRHECAEALGSIASKDCLPILQHFNSGKNSETPRVVTDSCLVAIDMYNHENDPDSFHYAHYQ